MPFVHRAKADDKIRQRLQLGRLHRRNDHRGFPEATGIAVTYDTYSSTDEMQAKMLAGSTGYDVVDMAGLSLSRFVDAGIYQKLDKSKLPNGRISIRRS